MDKTQEQEYLAFASEVVLQAGGIAIGYFRRPIPIESKDNGTGFDPVTAADREIEAFIRKEISAKYPDHAILGEEQDDRPGSSGYRWVIDPIDGTRAFISGSPLWGLLLGLMQEDNCVLGLMHQPYLQETFSGSSAGAFLQRGAERRPLATRATRNLDTATLYCTHPSMFVAEQDYKRFMNVADQCRLMRYGGDCYAYCLLAGGYIDLVIEHVGGPYDIVPLIPIITAAGGVVTDWQGGAAIAGEKILAAANPIVHEQALSILNA